MSSEEKRSRYVLIILIIILAVSAFCSLFIGRFSVTPGEVMTILLEKLKRTANESPAENVVWDIRFSRVVLNIIVGAGLTASGTAFQAIFQNRLVSPDILGVSNGAGFGAALAILLVGGIAGWVISFAFAFGLLSVFITFMLAKSNRGTSSISMVLSGIIVSSLFGALISFVKLVADTDSELPAITYWLMGSFAGTTFRKVLIAAIPVCIGLGVLLLMRWRLNILSMGDEEAYTLGINPQQSRVIIVVASTVITAACVAVTGVIGWVGMILPNVCRVYITADNKLLLPISCVAGAVFLLLVDLIARSVTAAEIPIGILTALVGTPIFAALYRKGYGDRREA